jgi:hypothetical protein
VIALGLIGVGVREPMRRCSCRSHRRRATRGAPSPFPDHARAHAELGITAEDAGVLRKVFVAEVISTCPQNGLDAPLARLHRDAWNAVLRLGIDALPG